MLSNHIIAINTIIDYIILSQGMLVSTRDLIHQNLHQCIILVILAVLYQLIPTSFFKQKVQNFGDSRRSVEIGGDWWRLFFDS